MILSWVEDIQMSVHSDLGLSSGFPLLASDVVLYGLVSSSLLISGKASAMEVPWDSLYLFLWLLLYRVLSHFLPFFWSVLDRRFSKLGSVLSKFLLTS